MKKIVFYELMHYNNYRLNMVCKAILNGQSVWDWYHQQERENPEYSIHIKQVITEED